MIKVLHIADSYNGGGAEAVFRETLKACDTLGLDYDTLISNEKRSMFSYVFSIKYAIKTFFKLKKYKPDIVHLHNYYHYLSPGVLLAIKIYRIFNLNLKCIFTAHDYHLVCPNSGLQIFNSSGCINLDDVPAYSYKNIFRYDSRGVGYSFYKFCQFFINYKLLNSHSVIDCILSPSVFLKDVFLCNNDFKEIKVVRNPMPDNFFSERRIGVIDESIKLVYFGRVSREKGLVEFCKSYILNVSLNVEINIYGEGDDRILSALKELESSSISFVFHGYKSRNDFFMELPSYDAFFLPSIWVENAPLSIIEAAACGLPVIVNDLGGMREMAMQTKEFYLLNGSVSGFRNYLLNVKENHLGNHVLRKKDFSFETFVDELSNIYCGN